MCFCKFKYSEGKKKEGTSLKELKHSYLYVPSSKDCKFPKVLQYKYITGYQKDKYVRFCCKSYKFINILYEKGKG